MNDNNLQFETLLNQLEADLLQCIEKRQLKNPIMIGIHSGGAWVAEKLHKKLQLTEPIGLMDISFYRDDFSKTGMNLNVKPSQLPHHLDGRDVILIDDVFYTGRTSRAALNEIFDYGRPNQVILGVLVERDGQQVPMKPDCKGHYLKLTTQQRVKLNGPDPLWLEIISADPEQTNSGYEQSAI